MAYDKAVDSTQLDADLTLIADAIRTKGGTSASLAFPSGFIDAIDDIPTGGGDTPPPADGKTRLYIRVDDLVRPLVTIRFGQTVDNGVTVDWGDGSTPETFTGTTVANRAHTYTAVGDYIISLHVTEGGLTLEGNSSYGVMGVKNATGYRNIFRLKKVVLGSNITSIGTYAFEKHYTLNSITIPEGVTNIGSQAFSLCYSLTRMTIPNSVTAIYLQAFNNCASIKEYHFLPTTPPTLSGSNVFDGIQSDCIIYVPYSADGSILAAYKTATNWSTYASYMREEPQ